MAFYRRLICGRLLFSGGCSRMSTAAAGPTDKIKIRNSSSCSSPWLMLPPKLDDNGGDTSCNINYNFYSLAENRVLTPRPHMIKGGGGALMPKPIHDLKFCGSSHGWLALFHPRTCQLFLYDPISHRRIDLPRIPNIPINYRLRTVTKVILSDHEDERNCRAVMIYNHMCTLAFCCPGHGKEWIPFGKTHQSHTCYNDIVYSSRQNLFFAHNQEDNQLETWDLSDPSSPRMIKFIKMAVGECYCDYDDMSPKDMLPRQKEYLVVADEDHGVLCVTRHVMHEMAPDGSYVQSYHGTPKVVYPHMTIDFSIHVYDQEEGDLKPASLGDLALFIGCQSDSVTLSATRFPELKPNSIYFTDPYQTRVDPSSDELFGGHDIGIFDYENKAVSPCYYPRDVRSLKRVAPSPMWFFPRGL